MSNQVHMEKIAIPGDSIKRKPNPLWNNFVNLHARSSSMVVLEAQDPYVTVLKKLGLYLEFFFHS